MKLNGKILLILRENLISKIATHKIGEHVSHDFLNKRGE